MNIIIIPAPLFALYHTHHARVPYIRIPIIIIIIPFFLSPPLPTFSDGRAINHSRGETERRARATRPSFGRPPALRSASAARAIADRFSRGREIVDDWYTSFGSVPVWCSVNNTNCNTAVLQYCNLPTGKHLTISPRFAPRTWCESKISRSPRKFFDSPWLRVIKSIAIASIVILKHAPYCTIFEFKFTYWKCVYFFFLMRASIETHIHVRWQQCAKRFNTKYN